MIELKTFKDFKIWVPTVVDIAPLQCTDSRSFINWEK